MDTIFNLDPLQKFLLIAVNLWVVVIFPVFVIRKINYLTALVESVLERDQDGNEAPGDL